MDSDEEGEYALPPSPSPAPRTRPKGPRAAPTIEPAGSNKYAHQREASSSSFSSYKGVATTAQAALTIKPSIRPVTDESLRVFNAAKSPYPTRPSQILYPPGAQNLLLEGFKIVDVARNSGSSKSNSFQQQTQELQSSSNNSLNDWTTNTQINPVPTNILTTSDTPKVRNEHTLLNASLAPVFESPSLPTLHNEPRLVPLSAQSSRSFPYKTSPGELVSINDHDDDYNFTSSPYYYSSTGIDVDRLAMVEGSYNANNDHLGVPPFLTPREQQHTRHGSSSSPLEPGTVSTSQRSSGGGLGAIASAASDLTFNSTPSSAADSVDSSGTVIRKKGYTGPLPAGYYSLFPPVITSPPGTPGQATIPTSQPRSRRSSSAPPRPVSEGPLSPISGGTNSPVSPISPEDNDSLYTSSRPHSRSRSESLFNIGQAPSLPSVLVAGHDSAISSQPIISNQIPRKPVSRSNAVRWNSFMSTIHSESEADARSSVQKSLNDSSSDSNNKSTTSSPFKLREELRRSSSALPLPLDENEVALPSTSATLDFSQIDTAFPLAESEEEEEEPAIQPPRRRVSSAANKGRMDSTVTYASLPSQPNRKQSNAVTSPTSLYSTRLEYRDSQSQTDAGFRGGRTGSLLRDSLPTWARYTHNFVPVREPAPGPLSPNYGSIACPNCSERWSPAIFPNSSHLSVQPFQSKAVKFNATENRHTNESQRLYYSNETRHRETLGHVPVARGGSNRRHTVGSAHNHTDSLQTARDREANSARIRSPHSRHQSLPIDRSVFRGEEVVQVDKIPRLSHNRAAAIRRRTLFLAPSIDEVVEGNGLTRRNIQVWSFAIGFIFPIGMFHTMNYNALADNDLYSLVDSCLASSTSMSTYSTNLTRI